MKLLIDRGVDVNAKTDDDFTPLHVAAQEGHVEVVKFLLDGDANVNFKNKHGWTPLHLANEQRWIAKETMNKANIQRGNEIVNILIEHGAELNCRKSPLLQVAVERGIFNIETSSRIDSSAILFR